MACQHLQQLFQLCHERQIRVGGSDLVRFVCQECGEQEVCPSVLMEEYEQSRLDEQPAESKQPA
jgi:hypothetical protein